jgi:thiazole synthase ThiGH ThiG subunit
MKRNRHGDHATTVVVGAERVLSRGKWRTVEVRACQVTFSPHPQQIEAARRAYDAWRKALTWTKDGLIAGRMLREIELNHKLPVAAPWSRFCKTVVRR